MSLPRILVIDDQFGSSIEDRRNLCLSFGLRDITGDDTTPENIEAPLAEARFTSAQKQVNGVITNDVQIALSAVGDGWPHKDGWRWSMVLLDIRFVSGRVDERGEIEGGAGDDDFGMRILEEIHKRYPDIPIVMLSSRERKKVLEECLRKGAKDFIQRTAYSPDTTPPKTVLGQKLFEHALLPDIREPSDGLKIVGNSLSILNILRSARTMATGRSNILLLGETGTGKELLARYIHDMSSNLAGPYVVFDASHTAETLHEDALFGHVKGAFTDAKDDKPGLFEMADGGTLFMDEIGDISYNLQAKLRRPLEERVVTRQGGKKGIRINTQVVLATNRDLYEDAQAGRFRSDLLNRINVSPITLPPLNERRDDIPLIAVALLEILCRKHSARWPRTITPDAMERLVNHDWSGSNVRGLRKVLEQAVLNSRDVELIVPSHIRFDHPIEPVKVQAAGVAGAAPPRPEGDIYISPAASKALTEKLFEQGKLSDYYLEMVNYVLWALEKSKDERDNEPIYPKAWFHLTGETVTGSTKWQREIGKIIFRVSNEDIIPLMKKSGIFTEAVVICGSKVDSAIERLKELASLMKESDAFKNAVQKGIAKSKEGSKSKKNLSDILRSWEDANKA